ncbi:hypothetical protein ABZ890_12055 [Streptomyces sp. NPDC046984]|uniref:hypothetical protein n=1 Tax=Streptomyces sp. NPDC046984 TaxID=3155138 RepID=UPI003410299B
MTAPEPGTWIIAALICAGIGCAALLAAGITCFAQTIRRTRRSPGSTMPRRRRDIAFSALLLLLAIGSTIQFLTNREWAWGVICGALTAAMTHELLGDIAERRYHRTSNNQNRHTP